MTITQYPHWLNQVNAAPIQDLSSARHADEMASGAGGTAHTQRRLQMFAKERSRWLHQSPSRNR